MYPCLLCAQVRGQRSTTASGVFLYDSPLNCFERGSLTELELANSPRLQPASPSDPPVSASRGLGSQEHAAVPGLYSLWVQLKSSCKRHSKPFTNWGVLQVPRFCALQYLTCIRSLYYHSQKCCCPHSLKKSKKTLMSRACSRSWESSPGPAPTGMSLPTEARGYNSKGQLKIPAVATHACCCNQNNVIAASRKDDTYCNHRPVLTLGLLVCLGFPPELHKSPARMGEICLQR